MTTSDRSVRRLPSLTVLRAVAFLATLSVVILVGPAPATTQAGHPELILKGGQVVTMADSRPIAQALAVKDGVIAAVGSVREVERLRGPDTKVVDLRGKTVIPGLQDSHIHISSLGWELQNVAELTFALSQEDILNTIREHMERLEVQPGEWVVGTRWLESKYEGGMVTRWQLDEIAPNNPVILTSPGGAGGAAVNTQVFELMGIQDDDPSTWPGWWLEDPANFTPFDAIRRETRTITTVDGETLELAIPTGVFRYAHGGSPAGQLITVGPPSRTFEETVTSIRDGASEMLSLGVTAIIDPSTQGGTAVREAQRRGWLQPLRVVNMYEGGFRGQPPGAIGAQLAARQAAGLFGGDRFLRMQGVKFFADGGVLTRSAWVSEPFHGWQELEGEPNTGFGVVEDDAFREAQYREAVDRGWTLHTHATGDRAMRQVTDLYMKLLAENPDADLRWSIEHAYLPLEAETRTVEDMAAHGIIASVQPIWNYQQGAAFLANLGPERFARATPVASYMRHGVTVASGSDYLVNHHNPWLGIYALLTREVQGTGYVAGAHEKVNIFDALKTYTVNGAYKSYDEDLRGSLEQGKVADLVVLDLPNIQRLQGRPSLALAMDERVLWTLVEGEVGYQAEHFVP